jgi:hypothetical protein
MFRNTFISLIVIAILLTGCFTLISTAQKGKRVIEALDAPQEPVSERANTTPTQRPEPTKTMVVNPNQLGTMELDSPTASDVITVSNQANSKADIDFIAIDGDGNEVGRETVLVNPNQTTIFALQDIFPGLPVGNLSVITVQASARPTENIQPSKDFKALALAARQLSIAFFSQRDSRWKYNKLGTCTSTIGSEGCAITCIAMAGARSVYNFNPATLNDYLTKNGGYSSGCLVNWGVAAKIDGSGGFTYIGTGSVASASNLKKYIDSNQFVIAKSYRFSSGHWAIIYRYDNYGTKLSDFKYLDPWDTSATIRNVGDGWVTATSTTRIYH